VALPIWIRFMKQVLPLFRNRDFPVPPGITFARVDLKTGTALPPASPGGILLPFRVGTVPRVASPWKTPGPIYPLQDDLL
jgi:penicillin-binding protein 1A